MYKNLPENLYSRVKVALGNGSNRVLDFLLRFISLELFYHGIEGGNDRQ